jgi:hypothetical protein
MGVELEKSAIESVVLQYTSVETDGGDALNIARIYCFLRMSTIIGYPVERIEPSPLNLSNGLTSFNKNIMSLSCY